MGGTTRCRSCSAFSSLRCCRCGVVHTKTFQTTPGKVAAYHFAEKVRRPNRGTRMLIGLDPRSIAQRGLTPFEVLDLVVERRLDGVQFHDLTVIDSSLESRALERFGEQVDSRGLFLEVGVPSPNPLRCRDHNAGPVDAREHAATLAPHLEAAATLGCRHVQAFIGSRHDRFRRDPSWAAQLEGTRDVLFHLRPLLKSMGLRLGLETHADATSFELLRLIERVGTDVLGVTLDIGNLPMRLEDPLEAVERLAPLVLSVHVKDAVLAFFERGLRWQVRPVGSGILPITETLAKIEKANPCVNLSIELHPRTYDLPIHDPAWLAQFPDLTPAAAMAIVRLAAECERRYREGTLERPEAVEAIPWDRRDMEWIAHSAGYLRPITQLLGSL